MSLYNLLSWVALAFSTYLLIYIILKRKDISINQPLYLNGRWKLPLRVMDSDLAFIEGGNPLLREVVVIAHKVEEPEGLLRDIVKENFSKGVIYKFIISENTFEDEKERYIKIFEAYGAVSKPNDSVHDKLVEIFNLNFKWTDYPYIFYISQKSDVNEEPFIFGYRGSQMLEGIADSYVLLHPSQANTLYGLILARIDEGILYPANFENFDYNQKLKPVKVNN